MDKYIDELKEVIEEQRGMIYNVHKVTGIPLSTLDYYIEKYELRPLLEKAKEGMACLAEAKLDEAIANGNLGAVKFFLERRKKEYQPKQQIDTTGTITIIPPKELE